MKVLFLGFGFSHYYNGVLNALERRPDVEVVSGFDSNGQGILAEAVYQDRKDVHFQTVPLHGDVFYSCDGHRYLGFHEFEAVLERIRPDMIVTSESYMELFIFDRNVADTLQRFRIKLILKSIPFRTDTYHVALRNIRAGNYAFRDCWFTYEPEFLGRIAYKNRFVYKVCAKIFSFARLYPLHFTLFGRKIMERKLELRRRIFCMAAVHVDYTDDAYSVFGSYGVAKEKIFIVRNSPDTDVLFAARTKAERAQHVLPENPHRFIHVGRLVQWKRVDLQIHALALLKEQFPQAELVIVGFGPELENLKSLARKLGVEDSVRFVGGVYDPEILGRYFLDSTVYVLAGMGGISINDAMAFGRPIVCSVCDGTEKKLVREGYNGIYFKEGDAQDLAAKCAFLFNHPNVARGMGEHSTEIIKNEINIHTVTNEYIKAFEYALAH